MIPKVSILIPNYNHKSYLQQRLDTVFGQTFQDFEVILLDDASIDGSQEILESYRNHPKVAHLIINSHNSGSPFKQWQKGIDLAKGEYVWIAESDDYCELTFLENLLKMAKESTGIYYSQTIDVDDDGKVLLNRIDYTKEFNPNIWKADFEISGLEFIEKYLLVKNVIPNASAVIFKRTLIETAFFSDKLLQMKMCGDWFFWVKLCEKTKISFIATPLNYFRNHSAISRRHNTAKKKKTRLLEEGEIRYYTFRKLNLINKAKSEVLLKKWFKLHPLKAILSVPFYSIHLPFSNNFSLFLKFLSFKLKK
ncbi:glycosyltransferase family 2 protein [Aequorivita todarodis]|uniref:glycosyltransferase family 2 protein n=1 Tax=Aequorivita todarodis TaxID=2036821 RepID=UPI0023502B7E|nr:glycosyltransferase family 2 protein [Aequorivita todarodis]MDC8000590.1 glycosyltransferase family 2 protein [Aequorivita todarodis]